ncbi:6740_t:CDS:2 [Rhizophagus irregularis]|nr:6740_t:CDS:2 [Rhizophagus irregularis]
MRQNKCGSKYDCFRKKEKDGAIDLDDPSFMKASEAKSQDFENASKKSFNETSKDFCGTYKVKKWKILFS